MKLLIVGLDGATFDILNPLLQKGKLPTLRRMIDLGVKAPLVSTLPPVTGPAWTSLATGKNPGKTGVFEFFNRFEPSSYRTRLAGSAEIKRAKAYWDHISETGASVGIFNYPQLYPPYPVNGFMISGLGSSPNDEITYPSVLKDSLIRICDGYQISIPFDEPLYYDRPLVFVKEALRLLDMNRKAIEFLLQSNVDVLTAVISMTDFAQHYMWKYLDHSHPFHSETKAIKYGPLFEGIWQRVDESLGSLFSQIKGQTDILIVSDHGFGPHRQDFYTNVWLHKKGYLFWNNPAMMTLQTLIYEGKQVLGSRMAKKIAKMGRKTAGALVDRVDLSKSKAFANANSNVWGEICINKSEESPLKNEHDYRVTRDQIIQDLKITCRESSIKLEVYLPEEIYHGKYADLAPDILFVLNDFECAAFASRPSVSIHKRKPSNPNNSGTHKRNGIFIAYGPHVKPGLQLEDASIYDIAPTVLHMCGLPIPDDMDGRVLTEIFTDGSDLASRSPAPRLVREGKEAIRGRLRKLKSSGKLP